MSSETSTEQGSRPDSTNAAVQQGMQPWQFFVLAGLGCATAVTFLARNQGVTAVLLLSMLMAATTLVGMAALRAIRPLVSEQDDRSAIIGQRTRAALEQEKATTLRTIKELEFDRAMGKMSEEDFDDFFFLVALGDGASFFVSLIAVFTRLRIMAKLGFGLEKPSTPCLKTTLRTLPSFTRSDRSTISGSTSCGMSVLTISLPAFAISS